MKLTLNQKKFLRGLAHALKPVVIIGQKGLNDNVIQEINIAIEHHELIKIRVNAEDREEREILIQNISEHSQAIFVQRVGHIATFYKQNPKKKEPIKLPRS